MHLSPLLLDVLWAAFALSVVAILSLIYGVADTIAKRGSGARETTFLTIAQLVAIGFLTCILVLLSHSETALWAWRILNILVVGDAGLLTAWSFSSSYGNRSRPSAAKDKWFFAAATLTVALAVFFSIVSFIVRLPFLGAAASTQAGSATVLLVQLDFWRAALFALLAAAVLLCVVLFLVATKRDGPLAFERSWGGLGGNTGGWEVSDSMTYLLGALALSALFLLLIMHEDARRDALRPAAPAVGAPVKTITKDVDAAPSASAGNLVAPAGGATRAH